MSVYGAVYFSRNGTLPGASRIPANSAMIDPDREAFSADPHDDDAYAPVHMNDGDDRAHSHSHPSEMDGGEGSAVNDSYDPTSYSNDPTPPYSAARPGRVVY